MSGQQDPENLEPSELGTKQYWDEYYGTDIANLQEDEGGTGNGTDDLSTWFADVRAPQRILKFLLDDKKGPFATPNHRSKIAEHSRNPSILDIGTGNGQTLFQLRLQGRFGGPMVGVDYSEVSIQLARRLGRQEGCEDITFGLLDIMKDDARKQEWWLEGGFDLVLDKGTFDAISLSKDVVVEPSTPASEPRRIHTQYPSRVLRLVKPGGFLIVTSCTWTQEELIHWCTTQKAGSDHAFCVWATLDYAKFKFGGHEGQGVCTVCFQKAALLEDSGPRTDTIS